MSMARGLQAISQASIAWSEREHTELQAQWEKEDIEHRRKEVLWRQQDLAYREVEKEWRKVDNKRRRVEEKTAQVALLARLSALMGGFQVAMFINLDTPSTQDTYPPSEDGTEMSVWDSNMLLSQPLLTIWSVVCASVIALNFTVMVMSSLIQLSVVQATGDEGDSRLDFQPAHALWSPTVREGTGGPDGIIVSEEHFKQMWEGKFDQRFRLLMSLFSYGIPLYFLSLGLGAMIKFYMCPVAAWLALSLTVVFMGVWLKYHASHMNYLTWRPASQQAKQVRPAKRRLFWRVLRNIVTCKWCRKKKGYEPRTAGGEGAEYLGGDSSNFSAGARAASPAGSLRADAANRGVSGRGHSQAVGGQGGGQRMVEQRNCNRIVITEL